MAKSSTSQLILDDHYIYNARDYFEKAGSALETKLDKLISILRIVCNDGCISGEKAEAMKVYTARVILLRDTIIEHEKKCKEFVLNFKEEIDSIDKDLY